MTRPDFPGWSGRIVQNSGSGDVEYRLGMSIDRPTCFAPASSGQNMHISVLDTPCHLEAVAPVVLGKTRARQFYNGDKDGRHTMPVLLHGDGAFSGQVRTHVLPQAALVPGVVGEMSFSGILFRPRSALCCVVLRFQ